MGNTFNEKVTIGVKLTILSSIKTKDLKEKIFKQIYPLKVNENVFSKQCKFEWKVDGELMDKFKKAYNGKYFESETFNGNMWNLRCAPNGDRTEDEGKVDLMLQLN